MAASADRSRSHKPLRGPVLVALAMSALGLATGWARHGTPSTVPDRAAIARLPLHFEANRGQVDPRVDFFARGNGYDVFLTGGEAVLALAGSGAAGPPGSDTAARGDSVAAIPQSPDRPAVLRFAWAGGRADAEAEGVDRLPGRSHYFIGRDAARWRTDIPHFARVRYYDIYPGVDLVYYGQRQSLVYDLELAPGVDPARITLAVTGDDGQGSSPVLSVDESGNLVIRLADRELRQARPRVYQEVHGLRRPVAGGYALRAGNRVGFEIGDYDRDLPLIIDPVLSVSTYLGSPGDDAGQAVAVDGAGNIVVVGYATSIGFPSTFGARDPTFNGATDAFVTKLNAAGTALVYSSFIGGSDVDVAQGLALDAAGNAYLTGATRSGDLPTTLGALDRSHNGGSDAFVVKLNAAGSALVYATYLGGGDPSGVLTEQGNAIAVDAGGRAFVAGETEAPGFPTTPGAWDGTVNRLDAFVAVLNAAGSGLVYATLLGGAIDDAAKAIAIDAGGQATVAGRTRSADFPATAGAFDRSLDTSIPGAGDAFVARLNATGSALGFATFLGGEDDETAQALALDPATGDVFVAGVTASQQFPHGANGFEFQKANAGGQDAFVAWLSGSGNVLIYATYLGGSANDAGLGLARNGRHLLVAGSTASSDFHRVDAIQAPGGGRDAFLTRIDLTRSGDASLVYSTHLGGVGDDLARAVAVDAVGDAYLAGETGSGNFPVSPGAFDPTSNGNRDAFVAKLANQPTPTATRPTATPTRPSANPTRPSATPTRPSATPTRPSATPTRPSATPTQPSATPTRPSATPTRPSVTPTQPSVTPTRPTATPTGPTTTALPAMPSNLTCVAVCESPDLIAGWMVRLAWRDNSADETEFHVYREGGGQHRIQAGIARRDQTAFIDRKVVPGETYTYSVLAHRHADDRYSNAGALVQCRIAAATATVVPTTDPPARGRKR